MSRKTIILILLIALCCGCQSTREGHNLQTVSIPIHIHLKYKEN